VKLVELRAVSAGRWPAERRYVSTNSAPELPPTKISHGVQRQCLAAENALHQAPRVVGEAFRYRARTASEELADGEPSRRTTSALSSSPRPARTSPPTSACQKWRGSFAAPTPISSNAFYSAYTFILGSRPIAHGSRRPVAASTNSRGSPVISEPPDPISILSMPLSASAAGPQCWWLR
jgi:hypothetical protein